MELRVFDKTVQPLGAIDELASLLWHTKYFDVGTFSLLAPITDNNSRLLVEGNLITKHDGKKEVKTADGGVWRRAAQITYVHITKDENGLEQLEAQGYMLSWWLNKRCIYPQIVATGTNQYLINLMVKNNCGSAAGTKRRFPLLTFLAQETIDGVAVEYANEVYAQLGQEVKARAQAGKLGYAFINGYAFRNPATLSVTLDTAEGALNRVDRVVVRWDLPQRDMYIAVLKGTPSAKPTATAVTRTTEIWELALADIYVGKGVTRIQTQNITDQRFNSAVCGIVTGTVEEIDASVLTKQFTDFFNTYSAAVLDEFSAYKQSMEKYLTEIAGVYDSYVSKTEGLFAQYESQFNERYSSFESTLDNWDKELLSAYTEFMAKIKLFQSDAENEFNTWFESIKDKLGEDIAGSLQLQIEELAAAMQEVKKQAEAGTKETKEAIAALDERLKRVESGWGIDYKHDAVLGLCYMGAAYMSQHYERTVETAVLGATYVGNSYLANTF